MRFRIPDIPLALTLLWIWLGILAAALVAYQVFRWWGKRHPRQIPEAARPYAKQLQTRFNKHRAAGVPSKWSKPARRCGSHDR